MFQTHGPPAAPARHGHHHRQHHVHHAAQVGGRGEHDCHAGHDQHVAADKARQRPPPGQDRCQRAPQAGRIPPPALIATTGPDHGEADGGQHDRPEQVALEREAQQPEHGDHAADDEQVAGQLAASGPRRRAARPPWPGRAWRRRPPAVRAARAAGRRRDRSPPPHQPTKVRRTAQTGAPRCAATPAATPPMIRLRRLRYEAWSRGRGGAVRIAAQGRRAGPGPWTGIFPRRLVHGDPE